jgi:hypothetical protein
MPKPSKRDQVVEPTKELLWEAVYDVDRHGVPMRVGEPKLLIEASDRSGGAVDTQTDRQASSSGGGLFDISAFPLSIGRYCP